MRRLPMLFALLLALALAPAVARAQSYLIEVQHGGDGTVSPANDYVYVAAGDSARFEFTPGDCSAIAYVEIDNVPVGAVASYTFTNVHEDHLVYVNFGRRTYTITATPTGAGSLVPEGATSVPCGTAITYDISGACNRVVDVVVDGTSVGPVTQYTFTNVRADHTIAATFGPGSTATTLVMSPAVGSCAVPQSATITVTNANHGNVTLLDGSTGIAQLALAGQSVTFTLQPPLGVGTHALSVVYDGGGCDQPSRSDVLSYLVTRTSGTLTLTADPGSPTGNQASRITGVLRAGAVVATSAAGLITFREGAQTIASVPVANGVALFDYLPEDAASHTFTASYAGGACLDAATSNAVTVALVPAGAALTLTSSQPTAPFGTSVAYTAKVFAGGTFASWATGHVDFFDGGVAIGTVAVNAGTAVISLRPTLGTHAISALFSGDYRLTTASTAMTQTVVQATPTLTLTTPSNPVIGLTSAFTLHVVSPANATGTVTFRIGNTVFATAPLQVDGTATATYTAPQYGSYAVSADYSGDANVLAGTATVTRSFVRIPVTVSVGSSLNPGSPGETVTLTASLVPSDATGSVTFSAGSVAFATVTVSAGVASTGYVLPTASVFITAAYLGDATHAANSGSFTQVVTPRRTTTLKLTAPVAALPGPVPLTVDITPTTANGSITFTDNGTTLGSVALVNGRAQLTPTLALGAHPIRVSYPGTLAYFPSTATATVTVVNQFTTVTTLTSASNPVHGRVVDLDVAVVPVPPVAGAVVLADDDGVVASRTTDANGRTTFTYTSPVLGARHLTATFMGSGSLGPSTGSLTQTFLGTALTCMLTADPSPAAQGAPVVLRATLSRTVATGSVTFTEPGATLGSATVVQGVATITHAFADRGTHSITALYSGDTDYEPASALVMLDVVGSITQTAIVPSAPVSFAGDYVQLTATVSPAPGEGTLRFVVDDVAQPPVAPTAAGVATFVTHTLAMGTHIARAEYSGGLDHTPSTSPTIALLVLEPPASELRILAPNGGETWLVGSAMEIHWTQVPPPVTKVDLYVSRVLPPVWEPIALGVPNTGSYVWTVDSPGTNLGTTTNETAMIAVIDPSGQAGSDASDLPFSIVDLATPAALERFEATGVETGVRLMWSAAADAFAAVALERADAASGPWRSVEADVRRDGDATVADDRTAAPGRTYWYRLVATTASGSAATFGPVRVTAGGVLAFAFAAPAPNPARGAVALSLALPEPSRVRIAIADIAGREVAVVTDAAMAPGRHTLVWDGRDAHGAVAPGLYFVTCRAGANRAVRRLVVQR